MLLLGEMPDARYAKQKRCYGYQIIFFWEEYIFGNPRLPTKQTIKIYNQPKNEKNKHSNLNGVDLLLVNDSMRMFITTKKEAC